MGNTRKGALEDAFSTLNKIKKSKEVKTEKKLLSYIFIYILLSYTTKEEAYQHMKKKLKRKVSSITMCLYTGDIFISPSASKICPRFTNTLIL